MTYIHDEIIEAAKDLNVALFELPPAESEAIRSRTSQNFAKGVKNYLWEQIENGISIQNPDGWKWIADYVGGKQVLMFFNLDDERAVFDFPMEQKLFQY